MKLQTEYLKIEASTGTLTLPVLTDAERTAMTAVAGMLIFNSDDGSLELYDGSAWVDINHN